jgi:hypothetical protein
MTGVLPALTVAGPGNHESTLTTGPAPPTTNTIGRQYRKNARKHCHRTSVDQTGKLSIFGVCLSTA